MKGDFWHFWLFLCLCLSASLFTGCGGNRDASSMPWETGDRTLDSLLDRADRMEYAHSFDEPGFRALLAEIGSHADSADPRTPQISAASVLSRNRLARLDGEAPKAYRSDSIVIAALRSAGNSPYLQARLSLDMALDEPDLETKTDMLFGILPDFIDACDSMRVVETLYELNNAYGRVWDASAQVEYINEILLYIPDSIPELKAIMHSNIVRLQRNKTEASRYVSLLDSLRMEKNLMRLAPALGVLVYSDLYRLRGADAYLDTAARYVDSLEVDHDAVRVYHIQCLNREVARNHADSAHVWADLILPAIGDSGDPLDIESMRSLIPFFELTGDSVKAGAMRGEMSAALRSVEAYERAIKMARMNADRRISDFRKYTESGMASRRFRSIAATAGIVLLILLVPASVFFLWLRRRHSRSDKELKGHLDNARRRLTMAQMRSAEKERVISSALKDLETMADSPEQSVRQAEDLRRKLRLQIMGDDGWEQFAAVFTEMRPGFVDNIKSAFPQLTRGDLRLCCLLEMDLDTKHIAKLLMIRPESVKKHRQRLRAKFAITPDIKWQDFLSQF